MIPGRNGDAEAMEAWLFLPADRSPDGAYLVAQGLHYAGPSDPRFMRFCSVLAASGAAVLAPFLPDYIDLTVAPSVWADLGRAFDALAARPEVAPGVAQGKRPGIFSISFGSLPALRLAAQPEFAERIGSLVVFGGYADWDETIHFCVTGEVEGKRQQSFDPLNVPVVMMNLLEHLPDPPADPRELREAWREYVIATWGRPEMHAIANHEPVARRIAEGLVGRTRELFLIGCGVEPGAEDLCDAALIRGTEAKAFADPRPHLGGIRCPVHLVHGVDDDVIPHNQARRLEAAMPEHVETRVYSTGLYGHTSNAGAALASVPAVVRELTTMMRVLRALVAARGR